MKIAYVLVVIIGIIGMVSTWFVAGNVESNYGKSTKRNVRNLTAIYVLLFIGLIAGIGYAIASF